MHFRITYTILLIISTTLCASAQKVFFCGNDDNSIFICDDGRVMMSGENNTGQLGTGSFTPSNVPVPLHNPAGTGLAPRCKQVQIEGVSTFLALTYSGDTVLSWGPNEYGQAGDGTTGSKTLPVIVKGVGGAGVLHDIQQIASGNFTAYALTENGKVLSWGWNIYNQAGNGSAATIIPYPDYVLKGPGDTLKNIRSISAGGAHAMALACDGTVWVWGRNNLYQLGQKNNTNSAYAIPVKNSAGTGILSQIIKIEAGDNFSLALSSTDTLWGWGANVNNRTGTGGGTTRNLPAYVRNTDGTAKLSGVKDIAAGQRHSLALMSDQTLYAWGNNDFGQLGKNDTISPPYATQVLDASGNALLSGINYIATGDNFSIARTNSDELYIWGENTLGQLGLNDHIHRRLPVLLELPCTPVPDIYPGPGIMEYNSHVCIGQNTGNIYLTRNHLPVVEWQQSTDNFATVSSIAGKDYSLPYNNLTQVTYYRAVLQECSNFKFSPSALLSIDSLSAGGHIRSSATVRANLNDDTLLLTGYKGNIVKWEYSTDHFATDLHNAMIAAPSLSYKNLAHTTYYRAQVARGVCPAVYSDTAEIRIVDQTAIKVYNGFTPDGDNTNDEWIIDFIELFPYNRVEIYNRWGQAVFRTSAYDNRVNVWKGESNVSGKEPLPDGTYFYVIDPGEGMSVLKGFVVISR